MVALPILVLLVVVMVNVEEPLAPSTTLDGLNEPEAPLGKPLADSDTVPVKPATELRLTVNDVLDPRTTICFDGDAEIEKSGGALTVM
jgi:hypothetical protein